MRTTRLSLTAALAGALVLSACGGSGGPGGGDDDAFTDDKVVIGVLNDQTGVYRDLSGPNSVVAVEMAVAAFQEKLFLPAPLQWAVRLGAIVVAGLVVYAAVTEPMSALNRTVGLVIGLGVTSLILVIHGVVEVTAAELRLRLFPVWRKRVSLREISTLHRVEVNPLAQMGVLGLGQIDGATALALRKGDAVQVTMRNGHKYTVGLQRPEGLLSAVRAVRPDL